MNLVVNSQALAQELRLVNQVVPAKPPVPIYKHVKLEATKDGLYFFGTDTQVGFATSCGADVTEAGTLTVGARHLLDVVEQLPDGDVLLRGQGTFLHLTHGEFRTRLQAMPADEFPNMPAPAKEVATLPMAQFQSMARCTRYAISDKKHMVDGALFTLNDAGAALVSTDGRRLVINTFGMKNGGQPVAFIIPSKTLDALMAIVPEGSLVISTGENHLFFQVGQRELISRMIDSKFPTYERIIPRTNDKLAAVDRAQLAAALRRVGLASGDNYSTYLAFSKEGIDLSSSSADIGDAAERIAVRYEADPLRICINWKLFVEFLDVASERTLQVAMKDEKTPVMLTDGENHLSVITLMR